MSFQWGERPNSRSFNGEELTLQYVANGDVNEQSVYSYALAVTPAIWASASGTLYRQDPQLTAEAYNQFGVEVRYTKKKRVQGSYTFTFDTTGGTAVRKAAVTTGKDYLPGFAGIARNTRAIGINGDDVEGVEVVIPALKLNVQFRHPLGVVTEAKVKQLSDITGTVNSTPFLAFDAGEVLFLGATGSDGTDADAEVNYQFACSPNAENLVFTTDIGNVTVESKKGWQYLHVTWGPAVDDGEPTQQIRVISVDDVYYEADLAGVLGFGS